MLRDIDETFRTLRKINMKLNHKKCTFGAVEGILLGYMISPEGIKPCPDKTEVVLQLSSPRTIKQVQSLNGKLASLNVFLSKSAERSLPLFKTLKKCIKKSDFHWTPEAEQAFKQLKQHLSELPLQVAPKPKEELIVYMSATRGAISTVLMTERGTVQTSVYFVIRALQGPELNYTPMEKLVQSLVFAAKRLRRYFQAHPIAVITDEPIKQIISCPDVAGRLQKWSVILGEHNITYRPRTSVKGQILADFLVENPDGSPSDTLVVETPQEPWTLFTDGSSCFIASNNEAEYEALIAGLRIAAQMGVRNVHVSVDSKLVANQVLGAYVAKEENMIKYLEKVKSLLSGFANLSISQVPRSQNKKANALSKIVSTSFAHLSKQVLVKILKEKSIQEKEVTTVVEEDGPTWMTPIIEYLKEGTLPDNRKEASKLRIKAIQYKLLEGILYRRSAKLQMTKYYNARVRGVTFRTGDFVYCNNDASQAVSGGKLSPKWEGPYEVTEALGNRAYRLRSMDGTILPRTWNIANLKKCYL
ncbi:reverse transcriptase domain-containing protein [Tanacetum coccineum]